MTYPGGKNGSGVYQKIINQMPPHQAYIEGFLGHGAIMRHKHPANVNIGIDKDPDVIAHWETFGHHPDIEVVHGDALELIPRLRTSSKRRATLIYLDPPYLMETRSTQREIYNCELSSDDHRRLLDIIVDLPCMVMISGYYSEMYAQALDDWRSITYQAQTRGGRTATEWLWMNYPEPLRLHDYSYLGDNYRERERIKRKADRWVNGKNGLASLPVLERYAILNAIDQAFPIDDTARNDDRCR